MSKKRSLKKAARKMLVFRHDPQASVADVLAGPYCKADCELTLAGIKRFGIPCPRVTLSRSVGHA